MFGTQALSYVAKVLTEGELCSIHTGRSEESDSEQVALAESQLGARARRLAICICCRQELGRCKDVAARPDVQDNVSQVLAVVFDSGWFAALVSRAGG